jgi:hypothetical protein
MPVIFGDYLTIFIAETPETALHALLVVCRPNLHGYRRQFNIIIERAHPIPPLERLRMDQPGDTIDIATDVVDILALVDSPSNPIYRFVGVDIRHIRSAPLKVFQQLKAKVLILLSSLVSISIERGQ